MVDNIHEYRHLNEITENADLKLTSWTPPGPLSLKYVQTEKQVRGMIGPIGSGKTTTMLIGEAFCAIRAPKCEDGVRRYSFLCTRDSYRQLYKTAIPSWQDYFPPTVGEWNGGQDRPAEHRLKMVDDFGPIELYGQFGAIPDTSIRDWLDGFQVTSIIMNAANSHPEDVYNYGVQRIDRWPPKRMLAKGYSNEAHIGFDMNKTDVDEWPYEQFVLNHDAEMMEILDFPSGTDPNAENAQNLPDDYYKNIMRALKAKPWMIDILIHNKWGASRSGLPVYEDYSDEKHLADQPLEAIPGLELCIGLDAGTSTGGRPSAVFFQVVAPFRVRVLDELYLGRCGPNRFADALLAKLDEQHLRPAAQNIRAWCDPSAFYGHDEESDEETWIEIVESKLDIDIEEPESNELEGFRLETVRMLLNSFEGGYWMLELSPRCRILRKGFNSGYRYKMTENRHGIKEDPKPDKNDASHPHDALQHGVTGYFGRSLIVNAGRSRIGSAKATGAVQLTSPDFDIFS